MTLKEKLEKLQNQGKEVGIELESGTEVAKILEVGDDYVELEIENSRGNTEKRLVHFSNAALLID